MVTDGGVFAPAIGIKESAMPPFRRILVPHAAGEGTSMTVFIADVVRTTDLG